MVRISNNSCNSCLTGNVSIRHNKKSAKQVFSSILPYRSDSYKIFEKLIISSKPFVSCVGTYKISLKGHKGSITLEKLCDYVITLLKKNADFNEEERASGLLITRTIEVFNDKCSKSLKEKNYLTQLIAQIVYYFKTSFCGKESQWKNTIDNQYTHYTAKQFKIKTGKTPEEYYGNENKLYRIGSPRKDIYNPVRWTLNQ